MTKQKIEFFARQVQSLIDLAEILYGEWKNQDSDEIIIQLEDIIDEAGKLIEFIELKRRIECGK